MRSHMWKTASMLIGLVLLLLTLGIIMLASTSGAQAELTYGDASYFLRRQAVWLLLASIAAFACARIDYHLWRDISLPLMIFCWILLVMTLIPGVGVYMNGSRRWLRFGVINIQSSELAKFATTMVLAWWLARNQRRITEFRKGFLYPLTGLGITLLLIFAEPDFGTTMLVAAVGLVIFFAAGVRISYLAIVSVAGLGAFIIAIMHNEVRMRRIIAFLNPDKYAQDEAFQLLNAIYAFVSGGASGVGLGQSLQKRFYLPEAHTDFIFAIIGEELGVTVSIGVIVAFVCIFFCGIHISMHASDTFGRLASLGFTMMITLQATLNIAVVTGCLPTKGLPLPFISFGGSSLVISMAMIGVLINIARQSGGETLEKSVKDKGHRF
ncbi:MAG: putative lipid II flippase FtsW [Spartobacteria bacterium]|nr:putative lipid II flippase FtsW [Spartobacteria bacterium]